MIIKLDNTQILTNQLKDQLIDFLTNNKSINLNLMDKTSGFYVVFEHKKQQIKVPFRKSFGGIQYE